MAEAVEEVVVMPPFIWSPADRGIALTDVVVVNGQARLLGKTPDDEYDFPELNPNARYVDQGEIELRNMTVRDLAGFFWGSEIEYSKPGDSGIEIQFSFDGGFTWSGTSTDLDALYTYLRDTIAKAPSQMSMKAILTPTTDKKETPELGRIFMYGDVHYDLVEDVMRSLRRAIRAHAKPHIQFSFVHSGGATIVIKSRMDPATLAIYLEDERDPSQNLVQSYNPATQTITLTTSISQGTRLECQGEMAWTTDPEEVNALRVEIRPEPDYIKSHTPMYVLRHIESANYVDGALAGDEEERRFGTGELAGRLIERPCPVDLLIAVDAVAEREVEAYAMVRQVRDLFMRDDAEGIWQSLGMGYYFDIVDVTPLKDVSIPEDEFHDFQVRAVIGGKEYPTTIQEAPLAESIEIQVNEDLVEVEG